MPTGKVKFYDGNKGYGFIIPDNEGNDIFVHQSEIQTADNPANKKKSLNYLTSLGFDVAGYNKRLTLIFSMK